MRRFALSLAFVLVAGCSLVTGQPNSQPIDHATLSAACVAGKALACDLDRYNAAKCSGQQAQADMALANLIPLPGVGPILVSTVTQVNSVFCPVLGYSTDPKSPTVPASLPTAAPVASPVASAVATPAPGK